MAVLTVAVLTVAVLPHSPSTDCNLLCWLSVLPNSHCTDCVLRCWQLSSTTRSHGANVEYRYRALRAANNRPKTIYTRHKYPTDDPLFYYKNGWRSTTFRWYSSCSSRAVVNQRVAYRKANITYNVNDPSVLLCMPIVLRELIIKNNGNLPDTWVKHFWE